MQYSSPLQSPQPEGGAPVHGKTPNTDRTGAETERTRVGILRAKVSNSDGWWQVWLLDLDIFADGPSEQDMLRSLSFAIAAEYHAAIAVGQTPFFALRRTCPPEVSESWNHGGKSLRTLDLPDSVRAALSAAFGSQVISEFTIDPDAGTKAA